jgi:hypothetical protein
MATLVPVIKVENDYYFDLQQTSNLHAIAESILEVSYLALFISASLNRPPWLSITIDPPLRTIRQSISTCEHLSFV